MSELPTAEPDQMPTGDAFIDKYSSPALLSPTEDNPLRFFTGLAIGLILSLVLCWLIVAGLIFTVELLLLVT